MQSKATGKIIGILNTTGSGVLFTTDGIALNDGGKLLFIKYAEIKKTELVFPANHKQQLKFYDASENVLASLYDCNGLLNLASIETTIKSIIELK